jgi:two-component system, OmpR family, alkaline phosphatase synthesis response regulator PhoP
MDPIDTPVLIVEDDRAIRSLLVTMLRRRGIKADTACDGAEALTLLAKSHYSVLLLDAMMPRMTGYEFLDRVRHWSRERRPLIFLLTGSVSPRPYDPELVAGTIRKPFDVELVTNMVSACLRAQEPGHVA